MKTAVLLYLCILINVAYVKNCNGSDEVDDEFLSNLKCLVCKATILEMEMEVKKVDPRKKVEVSGFRLDPSGKSKTKSIQYSKSETYLTELMESICKDSNFSKVRQSILQKIITDKMLKNNGALDFTPDEDLSKKLNHFCLEVLEEQEDVILKCFMADVPPRNTDNIVCSKIGKYCDADEDRRSSRPRQHSEL